MIGIFGATGFTGRIICREYASLGPSSTKVALIGRSKEKLELVALEIAKIAAEGDAKAKSSIETSAPVIFALPSNYGSSFESDVDILLPIVRQLKVVIGCAGPFEAVGEPLIAACVKSGCCDYVDITGEMKWIEHMRAKYDKAAKEAKVRIACACGFDYLPNDYGLFRLKQRLAPNGPFVAPVDQALSMGRSSLSGGTIRSFLHHMAQIDLISAVTMLNPFLYIPEKPTTEIQRRNKAISLKPVYSRYLKGYIGMSLFGLTGSNFIHWVNWNNGYLYGEKLVLRYGDGGRGYLGALLWGFLYSSLLSGLLLLSRVRFIANWFIPKPGVGKPPEYLTGRNKFVQMITASETDDHTVVKHILRYTKGEGYHFTGFAVLRCAIAAKNRREENGNVGPFGVNCATALLQEDLIEVITNSEAIVETYDTF